VIPVGPLPARPLIFASTWIVHARRRGAGTRSGTSTTSTEATLAEEEGAHRRGRAGRVTLAAIGSRRRTPTDRTRRCVRSEFGHGCRVKPARPCVRRLLRVGAPAEPTTDRQGSTSGARVISNARAVANASRDRPGSRPYDVEKRAPADFDTLCLPKRTKGCDPRSLGEELRPRSAAKASAAQTSGNLRANPRSGRDQHRQTTTTSSRGKWPCVCVDPESASRPCSAGRNVPRTDQRGCTDDFGPTPPASDSNRALLTRAKWWIESPERERHQSDAALGSRRSQSAWRLPPSLDAGAPPLVMPPYDRTLGYPPQLQRLRRVRLAASGPRHCRLEPP
jgi:hypothetical protein